MSKRNESTDRGQDTQQLQEVSRLAELYARHRTAGPFLVWSVIVVAMVLGIRAVIYLVRPYVQGHDQAIIALVLGGMALVLGVTLFLSINRLGGKLLQRWGHKLFDQDGQVRERAMPSLVPRWLVILVVSAFAICVGGEIILGRMG